MKIKEIQTTIDMRLNLGDYEGISNQITLKADLEDGDDPEKCAASLYQKATQMWAVEVLKKMRFYRSKCNDAEGKGRTKAEFDEAGATTIAELKKLAMPAK